MTPTERRALLGDAVIAHIHAEVDAAPAPTPDVLDDLRHILAPVAQRLTQRTTARSDAA